MSAVIYKTLPSFPQLQLAVASPVLRVPRCLPSGEKMKTPPGPVANKLPFLSTFMRRYLINLAKQLQQGIEPPVLADAARFRVRPVDVITNEPELRPILESDHTAHSREAVPAMPHPVS